jgi:uncharacterized protein (TIGR02246 family)
MTTTVNAEQDLRALVATYMAAWNRGDGAGYASAFAEDADFTSVRLDRPHSRAEIAAGHEAIFATIYKRTRLHAEVDRIRFVRPDVAVLDVEHHLTDAAGVTFPPGHSHAIAVAERTTNGWQFVAFQNMVPVPG